MRIIIIIILIAGAIGTYWHFQKEKDFFNYDPIESTELDFENPYSEDLYTHCVTVENMVLKAGEIKGCPVNSETYPRLLKDAKAFCRCVATNQALLKTHHQYVMQVHLTQAAYKNILTKTRITCEHLKQFK